MACNLPSIYVQGGTEVCCHWHRMILPLRYYHRLDNYRLIVDTTIRHQQRHGIDRHAFCFVHGMVAAEELASIGAMMNRGAKIVWSVDDDYFSMLEEHPHKPTPAMLGSLRMVGECCHAALFSTEHLQKRFEDVFPFLKGKSYWAPNLLEGHHYQPDWAVRKERKKPLVAWIGCPQHERDLEILIPVVRALHEDWKDRLDLTFFGSCHPEIRAKWIGTWAKEFSGVNFSVYPTILRDFSPDIMLCPLAGDDFAKGRSDLKLKEAMGLGAAFLYSPVGPFETFPYGHVCPTADDFLIGVVTLVKEWEQDGFWELCRLNRQVAEREFFWGSAESQGQKQWNEVLDEILETK